MNSISYYDARTRFSELLDQVAQGKKILITRRGRPAAVLSPPPEKGQKDFRQVIGEMKALRRGNKLGERVTIRDLIDGGGRL
jgi:prevent-host-death family protein